jgi:hypothetical protein
MDDELIELGINSQEDNGAEEPLMPASWLPPVFSVVIVLGLLTVAMSIGGLPKQVPAEEHIVRVTVRGRGRVIAEDGMRGGFRECAYLTCDLEFRSKEVALNAEPYHSQFEGWGGACKSYGNQTVCTLTLESDQRVVAVFSEAR